MTISWPWRKKKQLQSLFEERVGWSGESGATPQQSPSENQKPTEAHPKNAPGPFYVVNTECMACGYPHTLAPDLMAWETDADGHPSHCYFKKQPEDEYELTQAIRAIHGSCCGALCYGGSDPAIRRRIG